MLARRDSESISPARVRQMLRLYLEKDPRRRLGRAQEPQIRSMLNWVEELQRLVPVK